MLDLLGRRDEAVARYRRVVELGVDDGMRHDQYGLVPADERLRAIEHTIRRGDTLAKLARAYGSDLAAIRTANPGVRPRRLRVGQPLFIPVGGGQ